MIYTYAVHVDTAHFHTFLQNVTLAGGKKAKDRLTALLCANLDGSEKKMMIVGKSASPRCFPKDKDKLPVAYEASSNAWMTASLFTKCDKFYVLLYISPLYVKLSF